MSTGVIAADVLPWRNSRVVETVFYGTPCLPIGASGCSRGSCSSLGVKGVSSGSLGTTPYHSLGHFFFEQVHG